MKQRSFSSGVFCTTGAYDQVKYFTTEEERDKEVEKDKKGRDKERGESSLHVELRVYESPINRTR